MSSSSEPVVHTGYAALLACCAATAVALGFIAVPSLTAENGAATDDIWLTWTLFSFAVAALIPLAMIAFRPLLVRRVPALDGMRLNRMAAASGVVASLVIFPVGLWFVGRPYDVPGGILFNPWPKLAIHLLFVFGYTLVFRYISLAGYWAFLRSQHPDGPDNDFIGSPTDQFLRPEYYDEDIRWLLRSVRPRPTVEGEPASGDRNDA